MSETAIRVENIGKLYRLGTSQRHSTLRDSIVHALGAPRRAWKRVSAPKPALKPEEWLWALRNVEFEVKRGELVGVIGRNGAGKSTLLKILSRITTPTEGKAKITGRVGSLLEVGTGFHPELSGRENIFLNGAILGMRKVEIARKFDEIVAFSGVEKFIDTPVKHYSSGMYMRLAFAVAAHIETEILLVDEVLSVGDAEFQKKCLGKMGEVTRAGRTVLFVSHNLNAVEQLCNRVIMLEGGRIKTDTNDVRSAITGYLFGAGKDDKTTSWVNSEGQFVNPYFLPQRFAIVDSEGREIRNPIRNDADLWVEIDGEITHVDPTLEIGYAIYAEDGQLLYWTVQTDQSETNWPELRSGPIRLRSELPKRLFNEGNYRLELLAALHCRQWLVAPGYNAPHITLVIQGGLSNSPYFMAKRPGLLAPIVEWVLPAETRQSELLVDAAALSRRRAGARE
jgi:homopolymeric O-antigen transport system ATP-binding protein